MLFGSGKDSGPIVITALLVLSQVILLFIVVLKVVDNMPRLDPVRVYDYKSSTIRDDRRVRTVLSPPVKVDADETTENVP